MDGYVTECFLPLSRFTLQVSDSGRWRLVSFDQNADETAGLFEPSEADWVGPVGDRVSNCKIGPIGNRTPISRGCYSVK